MLDKVKLALRVSTDAFDDELNLYIDACLRDLELSGVYYAQSAYEIDDPLVQTAVITYCRLKFGQPDDYDRLQKAYDGQKANLRSATGYTEWE